MKDEILQPLDFTEENPCLDCIKGKFTKTIKKGVTRSTGILELIHTDICGPFLVTSVDGFDSFITFTDDFFRYGYIFPINDRSEALDKFKIFKAEVENQHNVKIKVVRLDRGGEYYGKSAPYGQVPGPFAKFLQENDIVADEDEVPDLSMRLIAIDLWAEMTLAIRLQTHDVACALAIAEPTPRCY